MKDFNVRKFKPRDFIIISVLLSLPQFVGMVYFCFLVCCICRWILRSLGDDLTDDEIEDMINETDTDGSGTVDYEGKF